MRTLTAAAVTATLLILWHIAGERWLTWALYRIPPATPADYSPRYRFWHNGVTTEGEW